MSRRPRFSLFVLCSLACGCSAILGLDERVPTSEPNLTEAGASADGARQKEGTSDASGDLSVVDDPLCGAVAGYWPGELAPTDLTKKNDLSWTPLASNAAYTEGKLGVAFSLKTGALESQDFSRLATADAFAISLWWKTTEVYKLFVKLEKSGTKSLSVASTETTFEVAFGTQKVSFPTEIVRTTFAHLTLVLRSLPSGSSAEVYVNGAMVGGPKSLASAVTPGAFPAGSVLTFGEPTFAGALDEITIFNRAIDKDEARRLYETGLGCGAGLQRPVLDREALRCPPPATAPKVLCGIPQEGIIDTPAVCSPATSTFCCSTGLCRSSSSCIASVGVVEMTCATAADCAGGVCCATNIVPNEVFALECTALGKSPVTSCKATCDAGETQLCAKTGECKAGKCTGFKARVPSNVFPPLPSTYALGACLP